MNTCYSSGIPYMKTTVHNCNVTLTFMEVETCNVKEAIADMFTASFERYLQQFLHE